MSSSHHDFRNSACDSGATSSMSLIDSYAKFARNIACEQYSLSADWTERRFLNIGKTISKNLHRAAPAESVRAYIRFPRSFQKHPVYLLYAWPLDRLYSASLYNMLISSGRRNMYVFWTDKIHGASDENLPRLQCPARRS